MGNSSITNSPFGANVNASAGSDNPNGYGGDVAIGGATSPNGVNGARIITQGGEGDAAGLEGGLIVKSKGGTAGGTGHFAGIGQILAGADSPDTSVGVMWLSEVLTSGSGAPGATFTSLLYFDTAATTGGLYAWNGSAYTKVGLATT